jgi:histone-lysine N-methyltransferase SUV39H
MVARARCTSTDRANSIIRHAWFRGLKQFNDSSDRPRVSFSNDLDSTSPPIDFQFISEYVYGQGVEAPSLDTLIGCETCRPDMGKNCGCEYAARCHCLEYAQVEESRLTVEQRELYAIIALEGGSTLGLPKRFPYSKNSKLLVGHYLNSRYPIYECNERCLCGNSCKTRVVQQGRKIPVEIFKTRARGWGEEPLGRILQSLRVC